MNTCDTCKHWSTGNAYLGENQGYCLGSLVHRNGYYIPGEGWIKSGDEDRQDQIFVWDHCSVTTGPKFGCIHWEAKDDHH